MKTKNRLLVIGIVSFSVIVALIITLNIPSVNKNSEYDKEMEKINDKNDEVIQNDAESNNNYMDALNNRNDFIDCITLPLEKEKYTTNMNNIMNDLQDLFKSNKNNLGFKYEDLTTGNTLSYNENKSIFGASTIKAGMALYLFEEINKGNINLTEEFEYEIKNRTGGSGIIKNEQLGTIYTLEQLINYMITYSDNVAYLTLMNTYGKKALLDYWQDKGTNTVFKSSSIWGNINAHDANIFLKETYNFYRQNKELGSKLLSYYTSATNKYITSGNYEYVTGNKYGLSYEAIHDMAIVLAKEPYTLSIISLKVNEGEETYKDFFKDVSNKISDFHHEYWETKISACK